MNKYEPTEKSDVHRRFKLAAGVLQVVDNEFDRLSEETKHISDRALNKIIRGDLNLEISPFSLRHYLTLHFSDIPGFREWFGASTDELLDELISMEIKTIADLNEIIKPDINQFKSKYAEVSKAKDYVSFSALIRDILNNTEPTQRYEITSKGKHYLQLFAELEDDLRPATSEAN